MPLALMGVRFAARTVSGPHSFQVLRFGWLWLDKREISRCVAMGVLGEVGQPKSLGLRACCATCGLTNKNKDLGRICGSSFILKTLRAHVRAHIACPAIPIGRPVQPPWGVIRNPGRCCPCMANLRLLGQVKDSGGRWT